jgi:condensin complex subunit 2
VKKPKKPAMSFSHGPTIPADAFAAPARSGGGATMLTKKAREAAVDHLLPIDVHFNVTDLRRLFARPLTVLGGVRSATQVAHEFENGGGFDDAGGAAEHGGGREQFEDDDDSGAFYDCDEDFDPGELNLVAPAHHIERIRVAYATRAKRVDVKKLKVGCLRPKMRQSLMRAAQSDLWAHIDKEEQKEIPLSHTIHEMKPVVNDNVTVPFYFICMLHLANEMGLQLQSSLEMDDVIIVR